MDYYKDYCIHSIEQLRSITDKKGVIHQDIRIYGVIKSLANVKKIYGHLNLNDTIEDLGQLNYIESDFYSPGRTSLLNSLGQLEEVGGNLNLSYSNIADLGQLKIVRGNLNLRDTLVKDLGKLNFIGGDLFLSQTLKGIDMSKLEVNGKIRFWKDKKSLIIKTKDSIKDVGGYNLRFSIKTSDILKTELSDINRLRFIRKNFDNKLVIKLFNEKVNQDPLKPFYFSPEQIAKQKEHFLFYKNGIDEDPSFLNQFEDNYLIDKLRNRIVYSLLHDLLKNKINETTFTDSLFYYESIFKKFQSTTKNDLNEVYKFFDKEEYIEILSKIRATNESYSRLHELELKTKERHFRAKDIIAGNLNGFIQENIEEYRLYIEKKLDNIYGSKYSLFDALFNELKTVEEINNQFPKSFKITDQYHYSHKVLKKKIKESIEYVEKNKSSPLFKKYTDVLDLFLDNNIKERLNSEYNKGELPMSFNQNLLNYTNDLGTFIYFIENILNKIFLAISYKYQDDFRVSKGLPKIGEGWISETELFHKIKDYFNQEKVIHHGKPGWLGKQHVDIWFPDHKIGVEYQGLQHYEPIEFFGGKEAYLKSKERDERKIRKFKDNNAHLIEVRKGYDFEILVNKIKGLLK